MRGLLYKSFRETWITTLIIGLAMLLFEVLLNVILPQLQEQVSEFMLQVPFIRMILSTVLGIEIGDEFTVQMLQAFLWIHPVILALPWTHEFILCTRVPAGEIDRGTIDVLLGLPVSRRAVYLAESINWTISGAFVLAFALLGNRIGGLAMPPEARPELGGTLLVLVNLYSLYLAVGGLTFLFSSLSDKRGKAIAIVFAIMITSFLLNFLTQFWSPAQAISFLGVLEYYRPAEILVQGALPLADISVLVILGAATWAAGLEIFARRSICTT